MTHSVTSASSIAALRRLFYHLVGAAEQRAGTSRPRALAVLRLITNLNLVGAGTGRSALEDAIDVARRESVLGDQIGSIGDQGSPVTLARKA